MIRSLQWATGLLGGAAVLAAVVLLLITPKAEWTSLPLTALGAILASSIAALAALAVSESVAQRRAAEVQASLRQHRERVYEELLQYLTRVFTGGNPTEQLSQVRAAVAVWGNRDIILQLASWNEAVGKLTGGDEGAVSLTPEQAVDFQRRHAAMAITIRADLIRIDVSTESASVDQIASMVFDDFTTKSKQISLEPQ